MRFFEEARVVKKNVAIPPRPVAKREKEEPISLLEDKESIPSKGRRTASMKKTANADRSLEKVTSQIGF